MNIVVLGAGAIGSLYGAKLSVGHEVTLVGRPDHVRAIGESGLRLVGVEDGTFRPAAATRLRDLPAEALVLLTTKAQDSCAAVAPLLDRLAPGVTILCVQNGLYTESAVRELVGPRATVLRAITTFGAIFRAPGWIDYKVRGATLIEDHPRAPAIADVLTGCGLDGRVTANIKREMWRKAIFNCVINPITSIVGCEVGAIADPRLDPLKRLVIDECVAVARADGVDFDEDFIELIAAIFGTSRNIASMRQDLLKGRPTEIDYLNGAVAALGVRYGIACPVNQALATIIGRMEARPRQP